MIERRKRDRRALDRIWDKERRQYVADCVTAIYADARSQGLGK